MKTSENHLLCTSLPGAGGNPQKCSGVAVSDNRQKVGNDRSAGGETLFKLLFLLALPRGLQGPFDFSNLTGGFATDVSHPFPYRPANPYARWNNIKPQRRGRQLRRPLKDLSIRRLRLSRGAQPSDQEGQSCKDRFSRRLRRHPPNCIR